MSATTLRSVQFQINNKVKEKLLVCTVLAVGTYSSNIICVSP